jgi:hypothetical protein
MGIEMLAWIKTQKSEAVIAEVLLNAHARTEERFLNNEMKLTITSSMI